MTSLSTSLGVLTFVLSLASGCGDSDDGPIDADTSDASDGSRPDASADAALADAVVPDAPSADAQRDAEPDTMLPPFPDPDGALPCTPFAEEACYAGSRETYGVGVCYPGVRTCHQSGTRWTQCFGAHLPAAEDLCGNGLDDNCSGSQDDEICNEVGAGVWVDGLSGSDDTGTGSHAAPFQSIQQAIEAGKKTILIQSGEAGTVYPQNLDLSGAQRDLKIIGVGPTKPVLVGVVSAVHSYDVTFENVELRYPDDGSNPDAIVDAVHNYRTVFRNVTCSAPGGLPAGKSLYTTHHGYDVLFEDVTIDNIVLKPGPEVMSASYNFLNANDHGSGSRFVRVRLGSVSFSGDPIEALSVQVIGAWGYCSGNPDGVTTVRNSLLTGFNMSETATETTFEAINVGCYAIDDNPAGFIVVNNTVADIAADNVKFLTFRLPSDMQTWISGNIVAAIDAGSATGVSSAYEVTIDHSDFETITTPVDGSAKLGANMISDDPKFVGGGSYQLSAGSPCIDTGDPRLSDRNGTRSDMGAYGGPFSF